MELSRHGREYYAIRVTTDPAISAASWEASFDQGETWHAATVQSDVTGDWSAWLIAGNEADPGDAVAVLASSRTPMIRAVDSPEILTRTAPGVRIL